MPSAVHPRADYARARPLLFLLVRRDLSSRYAGSMLGGAYHILQPLVFIAIYLLIFSHLMAQKAGAGVSRFDYAIHLTAGIVPWFFFSEVVTRCATCLVDQANFLKKLAFPEEILHGSILLQALLVHGITLTALIAFLAFKKTLPGPEALLAFPLLLLLGLAAVGLGMILSVLHLVVRDIAPLLQIALQVLFWLTPIVYPVALLQDAGLGFLPRLNPFLPFIAGIQAVLGSPMEHFSEDAWLLLAILPFALPVFGLAFLRRHRGEILDQL